MRRIKMSYAAKANAIGLRCLVLPPQDGGLMQSGLAAQPSSPAARTSADRQPCGADQVQAAKPIHSAGLNSGQMVCFPSATATGAGIHPAFPMKPARGYHHYL